MDSVINQTLKDIEIICVDDGSTDGSPKILKEYAAMDGRVKVLHNERNLGAPGAVRNIGIKVAEGEYIGFVDSDDYVDLDYFEMLYFLALSNDCDVAASLKTTFFGTVSKCRVWNCPEGVLATAEEKLPLIKLSGSNWSKIYRREMILKNRIVCCEIRNIAEDNYFSMLSMVMADKIVTTSKTGYHYRRRDNSITGHQRTNKDFPIFDIYRNIDRFIIDNISDEKKRRDSLDSLNQRKIQDFTWFKADCNPDHLEEFEDKLKSEFPKIYNKIFKPFHQRN